MVYKILIVDDEPHVTEALKRTLRREPYEILSANSATEALQILARQPITVVISDENMPGMRGTEFLALVYREYPETTRIMLTGNASLQLAGRAINEGKIYCFLIKPCDDQEIRCAIQKAIQQKELAEKSRQLLQKVKQQDFVLQQLKNENPSITRFESDSRRVIIPDFEFDVDMLIQEINKELDHWNWAVHTDGHA